MPRAIVFPVPVRPLVGVARVLLLALPGVARVLSPRAFLPLGVAVGHRVILRLRERDGVAHRFVHGSHALLVVDDADGGENHGKHHGHGGHVERDELDAELFQHGNLFVECGAVLRARAIVGCGAFRGEAIPSAAQCLDALSRAEKLQLFAQERYVGFYVILVGGCLQAPHFLDQRGLRHRSACVRHKDAGE